MNRLPETLPSSGVSGGEAIKNAAAVDVSGGQAHRVSYLDDVLQNLLVDDCFVARCFMVQIYHHLQGPLSKGHVV